MVTRIPVEKAAADTGELMEQIRQLAFHLFESRGGGDGRDMDDWLEAERELIRTPESTLTQRDGKIEIRMAAEGYEAGDIHVTASPGALVVRAASSAKAGNKTLLGRVDLPEPIDADRATARLDHGVLYITAVRQVRDREPAAV
jgi:HSP20 family molecular chaperone IbpA